MYSKHGESDVNVADAGVTEEEEEEFIRQVSKTITITTKKNTLTGCQRG